LFLAGPRQYMNKTLPRQSASCLPTARCGGRDWYRRGLLCQGPGAPLSRSSARRGRRPQISPSPPGLYLTGEAAPHQTPCVRQQRLDDRREADGLDEPLADLSRCPAPHHRDIEGVDQARRKGLRGRPCVARGCERDQTAAALDAAGGIDGLSCHWVEPVHLCAHPPVPVQGSDHTATTLRPTACASYTTPAASHQNR
jgi:hypothetical protein